ncbi:MAG: ACP S-malonyltransferase, partial [Bauldia litoralis]
EEGGFDPMDKCKFVAGHSLGEYSALAAAGSFTVAETAMLLRARGRAMQQAVPLGEGAMAALLGVDLPVAAEIAREAAQGDVCAPADDNAPGQVVLSGHAAAIDRAVEIAPDKGARRAMLLQVSAPFHCSLMKPAADAMAEELSHVPPGAPRVPLVANVTASAVSDGKTIGDLLIEQVTAMVRWRESCTYMKEHGVDTLVEIGSGKVLSGLARRIDSELTGVAVNTPADIEGLIRSL